MKFVKLKFGVFLIFLCAGSTSYSDDSNLCFSDEVMIASCHLKEKKGRILSFCASADNRRVNYRFGSNENIELSTSFSSSNLLSRWVDAATYTVYFGFRRGRYSYVFGVPQETLGAKAFLDVAKNEKELVSTTCAENSFGDKGLSSEAIRDVEDKSIRDNGFVFPPYAK